MFLLPRLYSSPCTSLRKTLLSCLLCFCIAAHAPTFLSFCTVGIHPMTLRCLLYYLFIRNDCIQSNTSSMKYNFNFTCAQSHLFLSQLSSFIKTLCRTFVLFVFCDHFYTVPNSSLWSVRFFSTVLAFSFKVFFWDDLQNYLQYFLISRVS